MGKEANNSNKLVKGTIIYAIGNFGTKILAFLIVPLYTYYISTSEMGNYDLVTTTVSLLTPIITMRISDAAYRWLLHNVDTKKNCISATYRVVIIGSLLSAAIILVINAIIPITYCYYFIALLILGRWLESLQTLLRGLQKQALFALSGIIQSIIFLSLNVLFIVFLHQGVNGMFRSAIISYSGTILLIFILEPQLRTRIIRDQENRQLTKEMLKYSAPLVPSGLSWWVMGASDRYVIRFILGSAANGIYAVANKFPTILSMLFTIFNYSWTDVAIGSLKEGKETTEYSSKIFEDLYKLAFCFALALIPATKIVTKLILSPSYKSASIYISFLYLGALFQGFTAFITAGLLQGTKTGSIARSSSIGAAVNLGIDLTCMRFIGIQAASFSTFCGFFVMWLCRMHDTQKITPVHLNRVKFIPLFVLTVAMAMVTIWTNNLTDFILTGASIVFFFLINWRYVKTILGRLKRR
jgi:O-antigen/teichoic acid export membrane protein